MDEQTHIEAAALGLAARTRSRFPRMLYLQKLKSEQAFWKWAAIARIGPDALPFTPLRHLVTEDRVEVSESYARRVLAWLQGENLPCPFAAFDEDGQPVAL
jgi:hypothetical protein